METTETLYPLAIEYTLLDLFCCGGGASEGYSRAGFTVTGVDIKPQPEYRHTFAEGDALEYLEAYGGRFDLIHASPPCQGYSAHVSSASSATAMTKGKDEPRLISHVRELLQKIGKPYVIENVMGARRDMAANLQLCGTMFGLPIARHRLFETSMFITQPNHKDCRGVAKRFAAEKGWEYRDMSVTGKGRRTGTSERWKEIMGITWHLRQNQIAEAIPPAYTEYIGTEILRENTEISGCEPTDSIKH